jgi:hypothetical protein
MAQPRISLMTNRPDNSGHTFREVVVGGVVDNYKVKDWLTATEAPNVNYDTLNGWSKGSMVYYNGVLYICEDATTAAAVWVSYLKGLTDTTFAPTITDEVNGVFTITNFKIKRVGDICTFSFAGRFDLDGGETSGNAKFDLPTLFQPSANWVSQTDVNVIISRTNGFITAESKLIADDSGTKLIAAQLSDTNAGSSIRFSAIGEYVIS